MKARFCFVLAAICASVLVACGGGGGGGSSAPPTVAPTATPIATATPTPSPAATLPANYTGCYTATTAVARKTTEAVGVQPITAGNSFQYAGSLLQTTARVSPCPEPTTTASASVTVAVTVTTSPGAATGVYDEHSVETDAFATNTTQTTTDAAVSGTTMLIESGETTKDLSGNTTVTTYGTLGLTYAWSTPLAAGTIVTNVPPATVNQTLADGSKFDRTYNTDGSYNESDTTPGVSSPSTINVKSTGAATYTINGLTPQGAPETFTATFGAPSGGTIAANLNGSAYTFKNWIPSGPLYSDTTVDNGAQTIPGSCVTALFTGTVDQTVRTVTQVDPALGTLETRTTTSYNVQNYNGGGKTVGPVCVVINDTQKLYYDYLLDTPYLIYATQDGTPYQTVTLAETYSISGTPVANIVRRDTSASPVQSSAANVAAVVAAHEAGIAFAHSLERAQRSELMTHALRAGGTTTTKVVRHIGGVR